MRNMNREIKKSSFLVSVIFAIVFLSIAGNLVLAGDATCSILPGDPAASTEYCPNCPKALEHVDHKPTPGLSGCTHPSATDPSQYGADEWCKYWIDYNTCDWTVGVHICKAVCSDVASLPYCSQVAKAGSASLGLIPILPFNIILQDFVPLQGCCKSDVDCNYDVIGTAVCRKSNLLAGGSSYCPVKNEYGVILYYNNQCCRVTNGKCTSAADCCSSNDRCINGICTTIIPDTTPPVVTIIYPWNRTFYNTSLNLNFRANEPTLWIGYSLDNQPNVTITGNTILTGLSYRSHNVIVYATDLAGNTGASERVYFTVTTIGDINGDCKVDIKDLTLVIKYYGTYPGHSLWNPNADINFDNKVDIKDLTLVNKYYGTFCSGTGTRRLGLSYENLPLLFTGIFLSIILLAIIFGILKLTKKKKR
jgi:hypothetical protein